MAKEYITWKAFTEEVGNIVKQHIGTCNKKAYGDIAKEVQEYVDSISFDNWCDGLKSRGGQIVFDTTEHNEEFVTRFSNIGEMELLEYKINWKLDKRNNNPTGTIISIEIIDKAPDEFKSWNLIDIPQGVHYLLAKQKRQEQLEKIAEYEKMIAKCKDGVSKFEDIMQSESWDKSMLFSDMKDKE